MTATTHGAAASAPPYIALYPTDFLADVGHLGNTELGLYWRLLLVYYRDARPLPFDVDRLRRLAMAMTPEEYRALDSVVAEFFALSIEADGSRTWRHRRADAEIAAARTKHAAAVAKAQRAAGARWGAQQGARSAAGTHRSSDADTATSVDASSNASSIAQAMLQLCQSEPEPYTSPKGDVEYIHATSATQRKRGRSSTVDVAALTAEGIDAKHAADWLAVRKAKRAPLTATALDGLRREADKSGLSLAAAVQLCAERGWASMRADWIDHAAAARTAGAAGSESFRDRAARERMQRVAPAVALKAPICTALSQSPHIPTTTTKETHHDSTAVSIPAAVG